VKKLDGKIVVGIASSALFDLTASGRVYDRQGAAAYKRYQEKNLDKPFEPGVAFPFIRRLLHLNQLFPERRPVEVILFSHNSPETGLRVFRSIKHHGLDITRGSFFPGGEFYDFLPVFNVSLFLSANEQDVREAIRRGHPAGLVIGKKIKDFDSDSDFVIAFDFDGVIADDASEQIYKESGLDQFQAAEEQSAGIVHGSGPLAGLIKQLMAVRRLELAAEAADKSYRRYIKTAIVTARSAPAHERVATTLRAWGVEVDYAFFLGGLSKKPILEKLRPHLYFDDQITHLEGVNGVPLVHIPFGRLNGN
jgi:5'-nucleotidase